MCADLRWLMCVHQGFLGVLRPDAIVVDCVCPHITCLARIADWHETDLTDWSYLDP
jgi:hypothetical protein